ncbi:MAG: HIT family protein [Acetatifactor sp.]|nr:HIT family protein [Acetatifactor sp.]
MKKDDCIFCKIANGEIPARTVYEDDKFRAVLDLGPATDGHTLILPKEHADNLFDLPEEYAKELIPVAQKIGSMMKAGLKCDGMNLVQNNGQVAGQTVMHFHLHLIPRYENDGQRIGWKVGERTDEEFDAIRKRIVG